MFFVCSELTVNASVHSVLSKKAVLLTDTIRVGSVFLRAAELFVEQEFIITLSITGFYLQLGQNLQFKGTHSEFGVQLVG